MPAEDVSYEVKVGDRVAIVAESLWCFFTEDAQQKLDKGTGRMQATKWPILQFGPVMGGIAEGEIQAYLTPSPESGLPVMCQLRSDDGWEYTIELPDIAQLRPLS